MKTENIRTEATKFLNAPNQLTAVIASCSQDGNVHAATIYYFVDNDFNFYFLTATNTQKHKNLLANPQAAIVIGFGPSYTTIQGHGKTELLKKSSEEENNAIARIKKRLQDHDDEVWPVFQLDEYNDESIAVFKFIPDRLRFLNLEASSGLAVTTDDLQPII